MNKYRFFYLVWLIPAYLGFLSFQQYQVHKSTIDTYENGETYMAEVTDFDIKQIAAQSNGYVDIRFETDEDVIERRLSLSIQMAQKLMETSSLPVRYQKDNYQEVVLMPIYDIQRSTSLMNMGIAITSFIITLIIAAFVQRFINRKVKYGDEAFEIERVDE